MSISDFVANLLARVRERMKWGKGVFRKVTKGIVIYDPEKFNVKITPIDGEPAVAAHSEENKDTPTGGERINGPIVSHKLPGETIIQVEKPLPKSPITYPPGEEIVETDEKGQPSATIRNACGKED